MKNVRYKKVAALMMGGSMLATIDKCLPEEYFALAGRNIAVAVADGIIGAVFVTPLFDALNLEIDTSDDGTTGTDGTDGDTTTTTDTNNP